jgi:hypothetical protein
VGVAAVTGGAGVAGAVAVAGKELADDVIEELVLPPPQPETVRTTAAMKVCQTVFVRKIRFMSKKPRR